jgi:CheY-like chemotaxis protein
MTTILLVEDNEMNRDMLARRIARRGYHLVIATDGALAVALAKLHKPDLILMDISLPVMDGYEATQRIRSDPDTKDIPILGLSAHAMAGDREKALAAGCNDYDTKPVEFPRLIGKMEILLGTKVTAS